MPMYYFHMTDNDTITDHDGTDLFDVDAARGHASTVARELMYGASGLMGESWAQWSMHVHGADGVELFSFKMSDVKSGNGL